MPLVEIINLQEAFLLINNLLSVIKCNHAFQQG